MKLYLNLHLYYIYTYFTSLQTVDKVAIHKIMLPRQHA